MKRLIKYRKYIPIVIVFLLGLVPIIWFWGKGDVLINGVDTNFPLNPLIWFTRRFYVWNNIVNAGTDFSSSTAGLFFHFIQTVPFVLGFRLQLVELISLIFWFMLIVFSGFFLSKVIFPRRFLPQFLFTVFYSFNVYLFNTWENVKVTNLSLVAAIPITLGILILLNRKSITRTRAFLLSLLIGVILSGTGINPSYYFCFVLIIFIYFIGYIVVFPRQIKDGLINFSLVILGILLINSFWIIPTIKYVAGGVPGAGSIDKMGFTNWVDSLSENTSIFNVIRLQGAWDWYSTDSATGLPLYIPYSINYFYRLPFIVFSLVAPIIALLSLIFRKKENNYLYLSFALMMLMGIFLGVGTHLPTGHFFRVLLNNIPFFSLFRSPWYIFTPLIFLSYAGLIGLLFDNIFDFVEARRLKVIKIITYVSGIILIVGNFLYNYPLITGKIFRPGRSDSFYVNFPGYVFEAAKWLGETGDKGRIIVYPNDEIENFKWGYRGIESILQLFVNRETLFASINSPDSPVSNLLKEFYNRLKKGEVDTATKIAGKLGASVIFEKKDQQSLSSLLMPEKMTDFTVKRFSDWVFYSLPEKRLRSKIYSISSLNYVFPYSRARTAISALDSNSQVVNPDDNEVKKITNISDIVGKVVVADNLQAKAFRDFSLSPSNLSNRLISRDLSIAEFEFEIHNEGLYQPVLEKYRLESFGINPNLALTIQLDENEVNFEIERSSDAFVFYRPIKIAKGMHKVTISLLNSNLIIGGDFESGERFTKGGYGEGRAIYEIKEDNKNNYLSIMNYNRAEASANFNVSDFDPFFPYYIEVGYKQIYGNNGLVVPEQNTKTTLVKAQNERLPNYPEWGKISFYYEPVLTESEMKIFLVSPFTSDPLGTKILYDNLKVNRVFTNNLLFMNEGVDLPTIPDVSFSMDSPVSYRGIVNKVNGPHILAFSENYSPGWMMVVYDSEGKKLNVKPRHFSINLYANAWFFENMPRNYLFKIYYKPQTLRNIGVFLSCLTLILAVGFSIYRKYAHKEKKQ